GVSMVRRSGGLLALIGAVAVAGAFSEGFDRLSTPHLLDVGMPAIGGFQPVVWFGILAVAGNVTGAAIAEVLRRTATDSEQRHGVALMSIWAATVVMVTLFAVAPAFWVAGAALLLAGPLRALAVPLWMGWMSDHSDPDTRATVLSFAGQADCLGQVACGPLIGIAAVSFSVEVALVLSALMLVPSVILVAAAGRARALELQPAD
ncbi:MAG: transporter, family, tetracycline resistance protein, partial [Gaiellales bacterium]|nr:transporter, family, tetracycline resistance protein [Gaiellales bacterium]